MTLTKNNGIKKDFRLYTDKYFLRSKVILEAEKINPLVRYQIFARAEGKVQGLDEAVDFIKDVAGDKAKVYALRDGQDFKNKEPLMKIEGRVQDLIELETVYLGIISGGLTGDIDMGIVREKARAIYQAARGKPVLYFGARHFHYSFDEQIARICKEEGFVGTSTDIGARAWNAKGSGTTPHASILSYAAYMDENDIPGNPTVEAAKGFDKYIEKEVPRINLIDTYNKEITDSVETAKALENLASVRIDTCGENYSEGSQEKRFANIGVPEKYMKGKGVTVAAVWTLRKGLDEAGFKDVGIVVSSGFNAEKTAAFMQADKVHLDISNRPLFTAIGTGSISNPKMATSDIVAYFNEKEGKWKPMSKVGRGETLTDRLEEIK